MRKWRNSFIHGRHLLTFEWRSWWMNKTMEEQIKIQRLINYFWFSESKKMIPWANEGSEWMNGATNLHQVSSQPNLLNKWIKESINEWRYDFVPSRYSRYICGMKEWRQHGKNDELGHDRYTLCNLEDCIVMEELADGDVKAGGHEWVNSPSHGRHGVSLTGWMNEGENQGKG